jgi:hypothetical protein
MNHLTTFELHSLNTTSPAPPENDSHDIRALTDSLPWRAGQANVCTVLSIPAAGEAVRVAWDAERYCLEVCEDAASSLAEFRPVSRQFSSALALIPHKPGVLVNGLPALALTMLQPRDAVRLAAGVHTFVTQRIHPYVGPPPADLVGAKCPYCRIPVAADSRVFVHRCGVPYHLETEDSHPQLAAEDRLDCFHHVRTCLSCNRPMSLEESLAWDPATAI